MRFPVQGRALLAVLLVVLPLGLPAIADASRWSGKRITYRDQSGLPKTVDAAARLWNRSVTGLRLVRAPRGARAMIRIVARPITSCGSIGCGAYPPGGLIELQRGFVRLQGRRPVDRPLDMVRVSIVAHEFGHALGLRHTSVRCDLMAPIIGQCRRPIPAGTGAAWCGPQPRDARALARLYRVRARKIDGLCRLVAQPRTELVDRGPFVVAAAPADDGRFPEVAVRVRNRSGRTWGRGAGRLLVGFRRIDGPQAALTTCGRIDFAHDETTVAPGAIATVRIPLCATDGAAGLRLRPFALLGDPGIDYNGTERFAPPLPIVQVMVDQPPSATLVLRGLDRSPGGWLAAFETGVRDDSPSSAVTLNFGDGTFMSNPPGLVSHEYAAPGSYIVTLTVTDTRGQTARATESVVIYPDPDPEPPPAEPPPEEPPPEEPPPGEPPPGEPPPEAIPAPD